LVDQLENAAMALSALTDFIGTVTDSTRLFVINNLR
jgi:hypothetical protein